MDEGNTKTKKNTKKRARREEVVLGVELGGGQSVGGVHLLHSGGAVREKEAAQTDLRYSMKGVKSQKSSSGRQLVRDLLSLLWAEISLWLRRKEVHNLDKLRGFPINPWRHHREDGGVEP